MITNIDRHELLGLIDDAGVQVVDVLPEWEYAEAHIPGAISIPLKRLDEESGSLLHRDKPVVVY